MILKVFLFVFCDVRVVDYLMAVPYAGFKNELEGYGTGDLGRVVAAMNAKALVAGRVLLQRVKAESDNMLEGSAEGATGMLCDGLM